MDGSIVFNRSVLPFLHSSDDFWQILLRKYAIKKYFLFPPHLTSASALPGKTGNPAIAFFT